jgi:hypothetical protein
MSLTTLLRIPPVAVLVVGILGLLAVPALAAEVRLDDDGFSPANVRVEVGEDIVWVNGTDEEQTVVGEDGTWDSGPLQPGETFSVALRDVGTFRYATADGAAEGSITVRAAAAAEEDVVAVEEAPVEAAPGLPQTGAPSAVLLGWALVLVGVGMLALRSADSRAAGG